MSGQIALSAAENNKEVRDIEKDRETLRKAGAWLWQKTKAVSLFIPLFILFLVGDIIKKVVGGLFFMALGLVIIILQWGIIARIIIWVFDLLNHHH